LSAVETGREDLRELRSAMYILKDNRHPHLRSQDPYFCAEMLKIAVCSL